MEKIKYLMTALILSVLLAGTVIISAQEELQTLATICGGGAEDIAMNFAPEGLQEISEIARIAACGTTVGCLESLASGQIKTIVIAEVLSNLKPELKAVVMTYKQIKGYGEAAVTIGDGCLEVGEDGGIQKGEITFSEESDASNILGLEEGIEATANNVEIKREKGYDYSIIESDQDGFYEVTYVDESGAEKTLTYEGMDFATVKVDENGQVFEASFYTNADEPGKVYSYTFGENEEVKIPGGAEVIFKDGKITIDSIGSIEYMGKEINGNFQEINIVGDKIIGQEITVGGTGQDIYYTVTIDGLEVAGGVSIKDNGLLLHEYSNLVDNENQIKIYVESSPILYASSDAFTAESAKTYGEDIIWQSGNDVVIKSREDFVIVDFTHKDVKKEVFVDSQSKVMIDNQKGELKFENGKVYTTIYDKEAEPAPIEIIVEEFKVDAGNDIKISKCSECKQHAEHTTEGPIFFPMPGNEDEGIITINGVSYTVKKSTDNKYWISKDKEGIPDVYDLETHEKIGWMYGDDVELYDQPAEVVKSTEPVKMVKVTIKRKVGLLKYGVPYLEAEAREAAAYKKISSSEESILIEISKGNKVPKSKLYEGRLADLIKKKGWIIEAPEE